MRRKAYFIFKSVEKMLLKAGHYSIVGQHMQSSINCW